MATMKNGTSITPLQQLTMLTMVVPDNPARKFSKCNNHTYLWTSEKGPEPPINQPKHLPGTR